MVRRAEGGDKPAAGAEGAGAESKVGGEEEPIWVKREREAAARAGEDKDLPYGVYLLFSSIIVIAVVRSGSRLTPWFSAIANYNRWLSCWVSVDVSLAVLVSYV